MMKLRLLFLYAFIGHMFCGYAQSSVMTISKDARQTATKELDGKSMVVFISKSDDIVINTTSTNILQMHLRLTRFIMACCRLPITMTELISWQKI